MVSTASRTRSIFPAPKNWAMTTVPPLERPMNREENMVKTGKPTPTAARAPSPT